MVRPFPSPWQAERIPGGYRIRDAAGKAIAYVYGRAAETDAMLAKALTEEEARLIADCIAQLPHLLRLRQ